MLVCLSDTLIETHVRSGKFVALSLASWSKVKAAVSLNERSQEDVCLFILAVDC
jgi:hypothetical protein